jgi:AAA15 family ATPase/GTPase
VIFSAIALLETLVTIVVRKNLTEIIMLKEITIENFKSFAKPVTFSLEAESDKVSEFSEHVAMKCDTPILKISSFYGPNGGGKTNLLNAIRFVGCVGLSNFYDPKEMFSEECPFEASKITGNDVISISSFFISDKYEIGYAFKAKMINGSVPSMPIESSFYSRQFLMASLIEESIVFRKKGETDFHELLFRDELGKIKGDAFKGLNITSDAFSLAPTVSALSYIMKTFYNPQNTQTNEGLTILSDLWKALLGIVPIDSSPMVVVVDPFAPTIIEASSELVKELNDCGIMVSNLILKKNKTGIYDVFVERKNDSGGTFLISMDNESAGTKKTFEILVTLLLARNNPAIFIADDLDAFLHPKLTRYLIGYFTSPENQNNQLIFNSHDILNMTNELFRRDEIWFAHKDASFSTELVPLSNIVDYKGDQVRKDAKFSKQYMEGRYGADPFIKKAATWYHD